MHRGSICFALTILAIACSQPTPSPNQITPSPNQITLGSSEVIDLELNKEVAKSLKIKYTPPVFNYPISARISKIQGIVVIQAIYDKNGNPVSIETISGPPELFDVAKEWVSGVKYFPLVVDGVPQSFKIKFTIPFKIH